MHVLHDWLYKINSRPYSEKKHWKNLGIKVKPELLKHKHHIQVIFGS